MALVFPRTFFIKVNASHLYNFPNKAVLVVTFGLRTSDNKIIPRSHR